MLKYGLKSSEWYADQVEIYVELASDQVVLERAAVQAQTAQAFAILALAAVIHEANGQVELTGPPRDRSQVIATDGGTVTGVKQSIG